jgi:hypothetical protein
LKIYISAIFGSMNTFSQIRQALKIGETLIFGFDMDEFGF